MAGLIDIAAPCAVSTTMVNGECANVVAAKVQSEKCTVQSAECRVKSEK